MLRAVALGELESAYAKSPRPTRRSRRINDAIALELPAIPQTDVQDVDSPADVAHQKAPLSVTPREDRHRPLTRPRRAPSTKLDSRISPRRFRRPAILGVTRRYPMRKRALLRRLLFFGRRSPTPSVYDGSRLRLSDVRRAALRRPPFRRGNGGRRRLPPRRFSPRRVPPKS